MDWFAVYGKLIEYRRQNVLTYIKGKTPGIERHHIIPLSQNGPDNETNIVCLTSREHFIAHKILHKMYPRNVYLLNAAYKMAKLKDNGRRTCRLYRVSSRDIGQLRKDLNYFLRHSKWINDGNGKRHRIWKDDPIPDGWIAGMGESSQKFKTTMNRRAMKQNPIIINGTVYSSKDISEKYGIPQKEVLKRHQLGWDGQKIISTPYKQKYHFYSDDDIRELRNLFEEWKTIRTEELIRQYPDIFNDRHGHVTGTRLLRLFKKKLPEYDDFVNTPGHLHSIQKSIHEYQFNGKTMTLDDLAAISNVDKPAILRRLNSGWSVEDAISRPVMEAGSNFRDTEEQKEQKQQLTEQMYQVFIENGYGFGGLKAVNEKFGTNIEYDGLRRKFQRYGFDSKKPLATFEYHGRRMTIRELSEETGLDMATVYSRLIRNKRQDLTIEESLADILPKKDNSENAKKIGYEEYKPMFDVYVINGGGNAGYDEVVKKFNYGQKIGQLRRMFSKYVPEYADFQETRKSNIRKISYAGIEMTISEFAGKIGLTANRVRSRLEDGWTPDEIALCLNNPKQDVKARKEEIRPMFEYWLENGFNGLNAEFGLKYKNEGCVTSLFRKYFKDEYEEAIRQHSVVFTDTNGKNYTIAELKAITGLSRSVLMSRIRSGCRTVQEISDYGNNKKERIADLLKKYLNSYNEGGIRKVMQDFPDCRYSGSSLRAMFLRYIPDLYSPSGENQKNIRMKQGEIITIGEIAKPIGKWARDCGLPVWKIRQRLDCGITGPDLLKRENLHANIIEFRGKTYCGYAQLAREFGISRSTLLNRLKAGMTLDDALKTT